MKKRMVLYDTGMGTIAVFALLGMGMIILIPLLAGIIILIVKTVGKIKQYRMEEQESAEQEQEKE